MKKPALDEKVERVALMRKQLVRVLDDDGQAVGEWVPDLSVDDKIAGLRDMMTVRTFDARMLRAHRQGKISFYMQALGEEAIACAQQRALRTGDMHFPTYRQQGLLISAGYPLVEMMNQILSNEFDPLKGRQLPVLYSAKSHGFFSISGNLATQYIQAVGWAMASALRGGTEIASAWIGEGASAEIRLPCRTRVRLHLSGARDPQHRQQPLGDLDPRGLRTRCVGDVRRSRLRLQHPGASGRRQRLPRRVRRLAVGGRTGPLQPRADADRVDHPAARCALHVGRPVGVPTRPTSRSISRSATRSSGCGSISSCIGEWDDDRHEALQQEIDAEIEAAFAEADSHGSVKSGDVRARRPCSTTCTASCPRHLREQRDQVGELTCRR